MPKAERAGYYHLSALRTPVDDASYESPLRNQAGLPRRAGGTGARPAGGLRRRAHAASHGNRHVCPDAYAYPDAYSHARSDGDSTPHLNAYSGAYAYSDGDAHLHPVAYADANFHAHPGAYADPSADGYSDSDGDAYPDAGTGMSIADRKADYGGARAGDNVLGLG